jgi:hypothetical protein
VCAVCMVSGSQTHDCSSESCNMRVHADPGVGFRALSTCRSAHNCKRTPFCNGRERTQLQADPQPVEQQDDLNMLTFVPP